MGKKNIIKLSLLGIIFFVTGLGYLQTFHAEFQFDDKEFIIANQNIRDITNLKAIWEASPKPSSRFVTYLTFALNYHFFQLNVFGYHVTNFIIHLINISLVWWLASRVILMEKDAFGRSSSPKVKGDATFFPGEDAFCVLIPFAAAFLFAVHPIQTQAVTYITQRMASLATLFYLISVVLYIEARCPQRLRQTQIFLFCGALLAAILAVLSKEIAITLPVMILFCEVFAVRRIYQGKHNHSQKIVWVFCLLFLAIALIIPWLFSFKIMPILFGERVSESHHGDILTLPRYLLTQARVWVTFLRLFVWPVGQNLDYDFPMSRSLFIPISTLFSFILLAGLGLGSLWIKDRKPTLTFGIMWFYITLLANLVPRRHVIFEHKMYLAAIGLFIALAVLLFYLGRQPRSYAILLFVIVVIFTFLTYQRNQVWRNEVTLWKDIIAKSPYKIRVNNNLGTLYFQQRKFEEALHYFNAALSVHPDYASARNNRGAVYIEKGHYDLALQDINRALELNPRYASAYKNKGDIYKRAGRADKSMEFYNKALELNPNFADGYDVRGVLYGEMGDYDKAMADFNQALTLDPQHPGSLHNKGTIYMRQGKNQMAQDYFEKALTQDPNNPDTYRNRGNVYQNMQQYALAMEDYNKAIQLHPRYKDAYNSRGVLYARQKKWDEALNDFQKALTIDPQYADAQNNLGMIYKIKKDYPAALTAFNQAISLNPRYASAFYNRSLLHFERGDFKAAWLDAVKAKSLGYQVDENYLKNLQSRLPPGSN